MLVHQICLLMALGLFISFWLRVVSGSGYSSMTLGCERGLGFGVQCNDQLV